jgi:hypothetical protein
MASCLKGLQPGLGVCLQEVGYGYDVRVGDEPMDFTVAEVACDYVVFQDKTGDVSTRVPVHMINKIINPHAPPVVVPAPVVAMGAPAVVETISTATTPEEVPVAA